MCRHVDKGIIFDMDNTLLKSRIDFAEMKRAIFRLLIEHEMWATVAAVEKEGMHGAVLEKDAVEVLDELRQRCRLYILTNNARAAAREALQETGIAHYFAEIVAREQMAELKPSPSGVHYILRRHPEWPVSAWTMVGDSWIDGKAAQDAAVRFLAYQGKPHEMKKRGVYPAATVSGLRELLAFC